MKNSLSIVTLSSFFFPSKVESIRNKILRWLIIVVTLLAFLEFAQDYIKSALNNSTFSLSQSLSYKLFWFIFIPFAFLFLSFQDKHDLKKSKRKALVKNTILILIIAVLHLFIFSLLLHIISYAISERPWSLPLLLTEKLSTRLYLGLSFYIIFSFIYYYIDQRHLKSKESKNSLNTLPIKYGGKTTFLETQKINWIISDGPYLEVNTLEKKYVILNSLKGIIESLPENFRRIHKSTIVNIDQIETSESRGNGDYNLVLKCGQVVRLSRNYAKPLKGILH